MPCILNDEYQCPEKHKPPFLNSRFIHAVVIFHVSSFCTLSHFIFFHSLVPVFTFLKARLFAVNRYQFPSPSPSKAPIQLQARHWVAFNISTSPLPPPAAKQFDRFAHADGDDKFSKILRVLNQTVRRHIPKGGYVRTYVMSQCRNTTKGNALYLFK
jgi:hypothetical protein